MVVLQNSMDLLKGGLGSSTETCAASNLDRNNATGIEAGRISDEKEEEDQKPTTIPVIRTEPKVSCVPVVSVCTFYINCIQNCLCV
jgi:hypothetical protein